MSLVQEASVLLITGDRQRHHVVCPVLDISPSTWFRLWAGLWFCPGRACAAPGCAAQCPAAGAHRGHPSAWLWCLPRLASIGDRIMSYTDLWVDLIKLLLYNKDASMGCGTVGSPAKQAAAWLHIRAGCADLRGLQQPSAPRVSVAALPMG